MLKNTDPRDLDLPVAKIDLKISDIEHARKLEVSISNIGNTKDIEILRSKLIRYYAKKKYIEDLLRLIDDRSLLVADEVPLILSALIDSNRIKESEVIFASMSTVFKKRWDIRLQLARLDIKAGRFDSSISISRDLLLEKKCNPIASGLLILSLTMLDRYPDLFEYIDGASERALSADWAVCAFADRYKLSSTLDTLRMLSTIEKISLSRASHYRLWSVRLKRMAGFVDEALLEVKTFGPTELLKLDYETELNQILSLARTSYRFNAKLSQQIIDQAVFEDEILARSSANNNNLRHLKQFDSIDISTRMGFNYKALLQEAVGVYDCVIIMPKFTLGGAETYAAHLAISIMEESGSKPLILTTDVDDQVHTDSENYFNPIFNQFRRVRFGWWTSGAFSAKEQILALLLMDIAPSSIFIVNSGLGLQTVKDFGLQLSQMSKIYCTFFSNAPPKFGTTYGQIFARDILKYATIVSDNNKYLNSLANQFEGIFSEKLVHLSNYVEFDSPTLSRKKHCRLLWASRWCQEKAIEVLRELALLDKTITIDVFGATENQANQISNWPKNIIFNGVYDDLNSINLSKYTAFIFTSYFEGMPNVLIEFGQAGIPLIASNVGGISETFDTNEIDFIDMSESPKEDAKKYLESVYKLLEESEEKRFARISAIQMKCKIHHSKALFSKTIRTLIKTQ
jgi:glycosyltransferase involved in cell wall biosynthesis